MENKKLYTNAEYAKKKGKYTSHIIRLVRKGKLKMHICQETNRFFIVDCEENDDYFSSERRGRPKKEPEVKEEWQKLECSNCGKISYGYKNLCNRCYSGDIRKISDKNK